MNTARVVPNFFIVGAPKCGTTSLYHYLRQHPEVFMPKWKEPHFFSTDMYRPLRISESEYYALFAPGAGKPRIGEASTEYLYSEAACRDIRTLVPEARIIIMLRNPVDMVYSGHSQRVWTGREDIRDFEVALDAEADRRQGRRLPRHGYPIETLFYSEIGRYSKYVRRYIETFGTQQVHVIIFDDLAADPVGAYQRVCAFLGIGSYVLSSVGVGNPNRVPRLAQLPVFFNRLVPMRRLSRRFTPAWLRASAAQVVDFLERLNAQTEPRPPMRPELRARLQDWFAADVEQLSLLLGRDLSHWVRHA